MSDTVRDRLTKSLRDLDQGLLLVVTGAGVSLASGIPTFRGTDPDAVWAKDVTELGTFQYFEADPAGSWQWYSARFEKALAAEPNPAHHALVALERWQTGRGGDFLLVTQNVDGLHRRAGSERLVEVHGTVERARCSRLRCVNGAPSGSLPRSSLEMEPFLRDPRLEMVPRCPACGSLLRQHILWFDEYYSGHDDYQFDRVVAAAETVQLAVFVGTSFSVGVTELVLRAALGRNRPVFSIDPAGSRPHPAVQTWPRPAELALPEIVGFLAPSGPSG